jgi:hypothetical protein
MEAQESATRNVLINSSSESHVMDTLLRCDLRIKYSMDKATVATQIRTSRTYMEPVSDDKSKTNPRIAEPVNLPLLPL